MSTDTILTGDDAIMLKEMQIIQELESNLTDEQQKVYAKFNKFNEFFEGSIPTENVARLLLEDLIKMQIGLIYMLRDLYKKSIEIDENNLTYKKLYLVINAFVEKLANDMRKVKDEISN